MTAARIRAQFPTSDGFGDQLKGCCRPPFVWASYNISRYIGRHSSRENNVPYCSHYSSSNTVSLRTGVFRPCTRGHVRLLGPTHVQLLFTWNLSPLQSSKFSFVERAAPADGVVFCSQIKLCRRPTSYTSDTARTAGRGDKCSTLGPFHFIIHPPTTLPGWPRLRR